MQTTIELSVPVDVATAIWRHARVGAEREARVRSLIAIGLFVEGTISLAKAADLAKLSRHEFALLLKQLGLPAYRYTDIDHTEDAVFIKSFLEG